MGYVGVNGIARKISAGYVGVNGVARKIIAGYVGVNGVAKIIWKSSEIEDGTLIIYADVSAYVNDRLVTYHVGVSEESLIDWGDGTINSNTTHSYTQDTSIVMKIKYSNAAYFYGQNIPPSYMGSYSPVPFFYGASPNPDTAGYTYVIPTVTTIIAPNLSVFRELSFYAYDIHSIQTNEPISVDTLYPEVFTSKNLEVEKEFHIANNARLETVTGGVATFYYFGKSFIPVFDGIIANCPSTPYIASNAPGVMKFNFGNEISVPDYMNSLFLQSVSSKSTLSITIYTDNQTIHDFAIAKNNEYTTYTVKHLDGSDW